MAAYTLKFIACLLMFIISSTWLSVAQSHQEDKNSTPEIMAAFTEKQELLESASSARTADNNIGGRKMALHKHKVAKQSATEDGKWGSNMKYNQSRVGHFPEDHEVDDASGFVAFNADYHAPRHHPPKNN